MQRRSLWIVLGTTLVVILTLCVALGAVGAATYRYLQAGIEAREGVAADRPTAAADVEPTNTPRQPRATATPRSQATEPAPSAANESASSSTAAPTPATSPVDPANVPDAEVIANLVSGSQAALNDRPDAALYRISATLDPDQNTIAGSQIVRYTNTEDTPLNEIYFRLYVNAPHYDEGAIEVADVSIDGSSVQPELSDDDTTLKLPLAQALPPGQAVEISMNFNATVPDSGGGYGIFNEADGVFTLYNWHPELAVYENGEWLLNPVSDQGDPTNTDAANYVVKFSAPQGFTIVTGGTTVDQTDANGQTMQTAVAALARNFVVVASDQFARVEQQVGETRIMSYYTEGSRAGAQTALDTTVKSLELFNRQFGPYPYTEMDVAQVDLGGGAAGMESTGLIMIGSDYYDPDNANPLGEGSSVFPGAEGANVLVFTTAHEVAHQWWYSVIGSDAYNHPWIDESITSWSAAYYVDEVVGAEAGLLARDLFMSVGYRSTLADGDVTLDQSVDDFSSEEYGSIVYGKGALMYDVLREEIGDDKFFAFLQRYYREQAFDRATSDEWLQTLNDVAGRDMTPFYEKWVESNDVRANDLPPGGPLSEMLSGNFENLLPEPSSAP